MAVYREDCVFCRELVGSSETNFARIYPELASEGRIVVETPHFVAFPCIGQLTPKHSLIVPRKHLPTIRDAIRQGEAWRSSLEEAIELVHRHFGVANESTLYFEHGVRDPVGGGCGIYHAHLHLVPNAGHLQSELLGTDTFPVSRPTLIEALLGSSFDGDYSLVGSSVSGFRLAERSEPLPSQTLRKRLALALDVPERWDWRAADREDSMFEALGVIAR